MSRPPMHSTHSSCVGEHSASPFSEPNPSELPDSDDLARVHIQIATSQAVILVDSTFTIVDSNAWVESLSGFTSEELRGKTLEDLGSSLKPSYLASLSADHSGPALSVCDWFKPKNRQRIWCLFSAGAFRSSNGSAIFALSLFDLSAQKKIEEKLRTADDNKDQFITQISHELRTPLSAILMWSQLFEEQAELDPQELQEGLKIIRRSALDQQELIEDLLDTARVARGKMHLSQVLTDLTAQTLEGLDAARLAARQKRIVFVEEIDPGLGRVNIDPHRWKQILWNLLSNAVKFTPSGGRITLAVYRKDAEVTLTVSDTGIGITAEYLPSIFEAFGQADKSSARMHSGLGLGLGITQELVRLHDGTIIAQSKGLGLGTTFTATFNLPVVVSHVPCR